MELSKHDQAGLRLFLARVYGTQAKRWAVTPALFDLTHALLAQTPECAALLQHNHMPLAAGQAPSQWLSGHAMAMVTRELGRRPGFYARAVAPMADDMKVAFYRAAQA